MSPLCPACRDEAEVTRRGPKTPKWVSALSRVLAVLGMYRPNTEPESPGRCDECSRCGSEVTA